MVAVGVLVGLVGGLLTLYHAYQSRVESFSGELSNQSSVDKLQSILDSNDGRIVELKLTCLYSDLPYCDPDTGSLRMNADVLILHASAGSYWLFIQIPGDSDAVATNGRGGAGNLELSGRFRTRKYNDPNVPSDVSSSIHLLGTNGQATNG